MDAKPPAEKARKPFKFKHFDIYQDRCAMKVSTDAMLLGSWAAPPGAPQPASGLPAGNRPLQAQARILDVGTGTGVLALMMAQKTQLQDMAPGCLPSPVAASGDGGGRNRCGVPAGCGSTDCDGSGDSGARIVAIDVDADAAAQAAENAALSPWGPRIRVLHASLQQLRAAARALRSDPPAAAPATAAAAEATARAPSPGTGSRISGGVSGGGGGHDYGVASSITSGDVGPFDVIISNPPYFVDSSKPSQGRSARASARHADVSLPFSELAAGCAELLAPGGCVCLVLPPAEAESLVAQAAACGLVLVELVRVFTAPEDARERRHLMRLQRAADLPTGTPLKSLPATSTLVVNGTITPTDASGQGTPPPPPRQQEQHRRGQQEHATAAAAAVPLPSSSPTVSPAAPRLARFFTPEYLALTAEFHHPAFLDAAKAVAAAAAAAPPGGRRAGGGDSGRSDGSGGGSCPGSSGTEMKRAR